MNGYTRKRKHGATIPVRRFWRSRAQQAYNSLVPYSQRGYRRTGGYFGRFNTGGAYSRLRRNPFVRRADVEKKFFDTTIVDATTGTTAEISASQNLIAQGSTESNRIGRKCIIKNIMCKGQVTLSVQDDTAVPVAPIKFRAMLVLDRQANGAVPTSSNDILETNTSINSFLNLANSRRFKILYQLVETLLPSAGSGTGVTGDWAGDLKPFEFYKKVNIPLEFDSTTGAITEIKSNNLIWVYYRNDASGTVTFNSVTRLRFTDI